MDDENAFRPGDLVGIKSRPIRNSPVFPNSPGGKVDARSGPYVLRRRGPSHRGEWALDGALGWIAESDLFHWWKPHMKRGDYPPPPPPQWRKRKFVLANIPRAREGMEARKVWDERVGLPFNYGPGYAIAEHYPKTVDPERKASRKWLEEERTLREHPLDRVNASLFEGGKRTRKNGRRNRSKQTRRH